MEAYEVPKARTSVAAISSLICGLLLCIPFATSLAAVILGFIGVKKTRDPMVTGKGMAITGIVFGFIGLLGWTAFTGITAYGVYYALQMGEPARQTAETFAKNLSEGKVDEAAALADPSLDRAAIEALAEKAKPWGALQSLGLNSFNINSNGGKVAFIIGGAATFATEAKTYSATLNQEGATYKVAKFDFL